jgi:hypothetical protein
MGQRPTYGQMSSLFWERDFFSINALLSDNVARAELGQLF